tara:strand:- start:51 stop:491 length:441 start_codon:yes stop_codon:yes gene_type:complete
MAIRKLIKGALRKAYKTKTAPLQTASKIASRVSPRSKIAAGLAAAASPGILNSGPSKKSTAPKKPKKETTDPTRKASTKKIKGRSAKGKVGKTRESDTSNFESVLPTMAMPGDDMASRPTRPKMRKMKAGGLAVKGHGKAFLKSKR